MHVYVMCIALGKMFIGVLLYGVMEKPNKYFGQIYIEFLKLMNNFLVTAYAYLAVFKSSYWLVGDNAPCINQILITSIKLPSFRHYLYFSVSSLEIGRLVAMS